MVWCHLMVAVVSCGVLRSGILYCAALHCTVTALYCIVLYGVRKVVRVCCVCACMCKRGCV